MRAAGTVDQDKVIASLVHARLLEGPGGAAEMVPGQHHERIIMYIAQATAGRFKVIKSLGMIDLKVRIVSQRQAAG